MQMLCAVSYPLEKSCPRSLNLSHFCNQCVIGLNGREARAAKERVVNCSSIRLGGRRLIPKIARHAPALVCRFAARTFSHCQVTAFSSINDVRCHYKFRLWTRIHLAGHECRREEWRSPPNDENTGVFGYGLPKSRGISTAVFLATSAERQTLGLLQDKRVNLPRSR
jgi:hypothetical protein